MRTVRGSGTLALVSIFSHHIPTVFYGIFFQYFNLGRNTKIFLSLLYITAPGITTDSHSILLVFRGFLNRAVFTMPWHYPFKNDCSELFLNNIVTNSLTTVKPLLEAYSRNAFNWAEMDRSTSW
jgi:hypothetical protein